MMAIFATLPPGADPPPPIHMKFYTKRHFLGPKGIFWDQKKASKNIGYFGYFSKGLAAFGAQDPPPSPYSAVKSVKEGEGLKYEKAWWDPGTPTRMGQDGGCSTPTTRSLDFGWDHLFFGHHPFFSP